MGRFKLPPLNTRQRLGAGLLLLSCLAWVALPVIPFLPITGAQKISWAGAVFLGAEIIWWAGVPLVGPELMAGLRALLARLKERLR